MKSLKYFLLALLAVILILPLASCDDSGVGDTKGGTKEEWMQLGMP